MEQVPLFAVAAADAAVTDVFGINPTRIFPFDEAPAGVARPYATWQLIAGVPENYLGDRPDIDSGTIQIDVYGADVDQVRTGVVALRDAIETRAHISRWGDEDTDSDTGDCHRSFDVDWWVPR